MDQYVLGIDGGATKTQCAIFDISGRKIDLINWGPTNHEVLNFGYNDLRQELASLTDYILKKNNLRVEDIVKSVFGMAGTDTREQHRIISEIIYDVGFRDFILCNDAYLGIKAGSPTGYGINVVNGTGCSIAGIEKSGRMLQIGGQGGLTGDFGGGGDIGVQAICSVYNCFFRCGDQTLIKEFLPDELKTESKFDFIDNVREKIDQGIIRVAELNRVVFEAANRGDKVATEILEKVGGELARSVNGMLRELEFDKNETIFVVLSGSINTKGNSPILVDKLKRDVISANSDKEISFLLLEHPPVLGAIAWALEGKVPLRDLKL